MSILKPLDRGLIDTILARAIGAHGLGKKHRQRFRWWIKALPMLRQQILDFIQQCIAGQQIETAITITVCTVCVDTTVLMIGESAGRMHGDRFLWLVVGLVIYSLPLGRSFFKSIQMFSLK